MLRTTLDKAYIKRTVRPLYGWTQATPKAGTWSRQVGDAIYPGMAVMHVGNGAYERMDATGKPAGLSALYVGGDGIDEPLDSGVEAFACWVLAPDAEFEVLDPAFASGLTWTLPTDGTDLLVHAATGAGAQPAGQLVPAGTANASTDPVARLVQVVSASKIIVAGLITRA